LFNNISHPSSATTEEEEEAAATSGTQLGMGVHAIVIVLQCLPQWRHSCNSTL
jgi:hypothetical protein